MIHKILPTVYNSSELSVLYTFLTLWAPVSHLLLNIDSLKIFLYYWYVTEQLIGINV